LFASDHLSGPERKNPTADGSSASDRKKKEKPAPVFTHKEHATLEQRIEILNWHHQNGANQTKTARHFDKIYPNLRIKQPLVSSWLKEESKWRDQYMNSSEHSRHNKRIRQTQHPEVTEMMDLWVTKAMRDKLMLTGEVLRQKWAAFADLVGIPEDERLNLSEGRVTKFKERCGLKQFKRHGEAASAEPKTIEEERK
jgi:hypothetical protein